MTTASHLDGLDNLDRQILVALDRNPDATISELAAVVGVARNTAHARLRGITQRGVLGEPSRRIRPETLGFRLTAFVSLEASQSQATRIQEDLVAMAEIVEVHATTGDADYLVKVVGRDTDDLRRITRRLLEIPGVVRSSTVISLDEVMPHRLSGLLAAAETGGLR